MNDLSLLKKLREELSVGFSDCQSALKEANGDYDKAVEILRKKGIANSQKKSSRITKDGVVAFAENDKSIVLIELNCETDFVTKNEKFQSLINIILDNSFDFRDKDELLSSPLKTGSNLQDIISQYTFSIGENISLKKFINIDKNDSSIAVYVHGGFSNDRKNSGKIISVVFFKSSKSDDHEIQELMKKVAVHVTANNPISLSIDTVPESVLKQEKDIYLEQARNSGKNDDISDKIANGKLVKFFDENVLLEQPFVVDGKTKVKDFIRDFCKVRNIELTIHSFIRWQLGQ